MPRPVGIRLMALAVGALVAAGNPAIGEDAPATFLHVSDIHFNPFDPPELAKTLAASDAETWPSKFAAVPDQTMSGYGKDTNHALLASALAAIARTAAGADFAVVTGDLLAHDFEADAAKALGVAESSEAVNAFAERTTIFVAEQLSAALPGKPVIVSLGNNDSSCGDYRLEPGGAYLAATRETVRRLVGPGRVESDFDETYAAGGYYAARHPTVPKTLILVVNDVLWSAKYQNACGAGGLSAGYAEIAWLRDRLQRQRAAGGHVWLVHHIPVGIDAYATGHSKAATCPAKVVPFLQEPFASEYLTLLRDFHDVVSTSLTGHIHFDDYRLLLDEKSAPIGLEKIAPAISPIFGQNPGFHMFDYDRLSGAPTGFSTTYLTNLVTGDGPVAGDWRLEYDFAGTYGQPGYSPETVMAMWKAIAQPGAAREAFRRLYDVSRGELAADQVPVYSCAIVRPDPASFTTCFCGN